MASTVKETMRRVWIMGPVIALSVGPYLPLCSFDRQRTGPVVSTENLLPHMVLHVIFLIRLHGLTQVVSAFSP